MSRKGKLPIPLSKGVEVKVTESEIVVKGPKGTLHQKLVPGIEVKVEDNQVSVSKTKGKDNYTLYNNEINEKMIEKLNLDIQVRKKIHQLDK